MSLTTELLKTSARPVFLVESTAGRVAKWWTSGIAPVDPGDVADCVLLVDARHEVGYSDGDAVPALVDQVAVTGNFAQASSARRGHWVANMSGGSPGIRFVGNDGVGDVYTRAVASLATVFDTAEVTYAIVARWNSSDQDGVSLFGNRFTGDTNRVIEIGRAHV